MAVLGGIGTGGPWTEGAALKAGEDQRDGTGPQGLGYYRPVGISSEKLELGQSDDCRRLTECPRRTTLESPSGALQGP